MIQCPALAEERVIHCIRPFQEFLALQENVAVFASWILFLLGDRKRPVSHLRNHPGFIILPRLAPPFSVPQIQPPPPASVSLNHVQVLVQVSCNLVPSGAQASLGRQMGIACSEKWCRSIGPPRSARCKGQKKEWSFLPSVSSSALANPLEAEEIPVLY